jgi:hypothetical protein
MKCSAQVATSQKLTASPLRRRNPKSEGFEDAYMTQDILQMGTDEMKLRHIYDKPFTVRVSD